VLNVEKLRDKAIEEGFTLIDEHPEGRYALLAKYYGQQDKQPYVVIRQIPKHGREVKRFVLTQRDLAAINKIFADA
jgi:hypothetical protein